MAGKRKSTIKGETSWSVSPASSPADTDLGTQLEDTILSVLSSRKEGSTA